MTFTVKITPRAQQDLKNIGRYTLQKWGKKKRDSYLQGSHLIFYTIGENCIHIIGIPHQAMDVLNYFDPD